MIEQATTCDEIGNTVVDYKATGGYITIDGAPAPGIGRLVVQHGDYVSHVIAVDTAPQGERLTYVVVNDIECPLAVQGVAAERPASLAYTGDHTGALAGLGLALVLIGATLKAATRRLAH